MPPSQGLHLDVNALSGICGSISIACWIVVFSPQIFENFRRGSAEGLSLLFIIVWLAGDVFNILGAILQGVLPTMTILAVYYTLADIVLLAQCFYYKGFTLSDEPLPVVKPIIDTLPNLHATPVSPSTDGPTEYSALLSGSHRKPSNASTVSGPPDVTHLSPATPLIPSSKPSDPPAAQYIKPTSTLHSIILNTSAIVLVSIAGTLGWYITSRPPSSTRQAPTNPPHDHSPQSLNIPGQIFGYLCAVLYLGSRIPQLILNYKRKSTEGVSMLFFLFACVGNLTYVLSILLFAPSCGDGHRGRGCAPGERSAAYWRYILVNASWLLGSLGTLGLDLGIFAQFWVYRKKAEAGEDEDGEAGSQAS
ncbi:MAG: hypothetical protein M1817_000488 [Caeruleum heppii]|nr:MAG: hypothetical protein M1817_000488 [Caeruleum heppii]